MKYLGYIPLVAVLLLLAGCKGGEGKPKEGDVGKDAPPKQAEEKPKLKDNEVAGWMRDLNADTAQLTLEMEDGATRKYEKTKKSQFLDFHSDPEGKQRGSFSDLRHEFVVVTLTKEDGKDAAVSIRPAPPKLLPPEPTGTKVEGKFAGTNAKFYPDSRLSIKVDGKEQEYPMARHVFWYADAGFRVRQGQDNAFRGGDVVITLVKNKDGREEVLIVRGGKGK
jgi:hypothetical protein